MSQLTARIVANFAVTSRPSAYTAGIVDLEALTEFYYGSGAAQADTLARASNTILASQTATINLTDWTNALLPGGDAQFSVIKALYIRNNSESGGASVEIGGAFTPLVGAAIPIPAQGALLLVNPSAAGWDCSGSANTITIENLSGSASATVEVAAIGVSV